MVQTSSDQPGSPAKGHDTVPTTTSARVMATDEKTGRQNVKTQTIEGAAVTVTGFVGQVVGDKYSWSSATYDVTSPAGKLFAGAITWDNKSFTVGTEPAGSLSKAVRAVLGPGSPPRPRRTLSRRPAPARAQPPARPGRPAADAASGSSVIEADPDTGLPRIRPEVQAKADAIVAAQVAKNAGGGQVSRPEPDPVARWLALIVQHHLITSRSGQTCPSCQGGMQVEAHATGALDPGVVITTAEGGNRYFLVRVAEFTTRQPDRGE